MVLDGSEGVEEDNAGNGWRMRKRIASEIRNFANFTYTTPPLLSYSTQLLATMKITSMVTIMIKAQAYL